ncbi:MAG TPA: PIN domain-containing protein, partial [Thermoanaerobaculia bacterium]|nr:PIN domain-containing protein [Thermoanaerobaculia bacterium]
MRFWDSSAVVPLLVREDATPRMLRLWQREDAVMVWWGTRLECASALARLERSGGLSGAAATEAFARLDAIARGWNEVQPSEPLRVTAQRLLRAHDLRAADALQLAAAWVAAEDRPASLEVVCLDERLA